MTKAEKSRIGGKTEIALMGAVVKPESNEEVKVMCDYIADLLKNTIRLENDEYKEQVENVLKNHKATGLSCSRLDDMFLINIVLDDPVIDNEEGVFVYCLNLTIPYFSEFGYSLFEKRGSFYRRIG